MAREKFDDLAAFVAVAKARSFTRAAAELGVSPSAVSQTMRGLEERLGYRLLSRTTRSVSPTEAGERLLAVIAPRLEEIETELEVLGALSERPSGTVRITCSDHAVQTVLWPRLRDVLPRYPDVRVELCIEQGFVDVVAEGFDAGVRLGESVEKDMVAVRVGPDIRCLVVGAPTYLELNPPPTSPQELVKHSCISHRLANNGGLYAWEFMRDGRPLRVRVSGQLAFNAMGPMIDAAMAGFGLAFVPEDSVREHLGAGHLIEVLGDWCPPLAGLHLYYPSRRQNSMAFQIIVDALRYRG